jgi:branched-chain amino acid transport system substrate-binding protein
MASIAPGRVWAQQGPLKIGVIAPITGGAAAIGKDMVDGLTLYLEQNHQQIAGRQVEVVVED